MKSKLGRYLEDAKDLIDGVCCLFAFAAVFGFGASFGGAVLLYLLGSIQKAFGGGA